MTVRHIEVSSEAQAQALIDRVDARMGLPRAAPGPIGDAARAWIAGGMVGPPPPHGITLTWSIPTPHPTLPRWSVVVEVGSRSVREHAVGARLDARTLSDADVLERTAEWGSLGAGGAPAERTPR